VWQDTDINQPETQMKTILAALLMLVMGDACAFDEWSFQDKALEGTFIAVTVIDWLQTRNIARHNCTNPATGEHDCYENGTAALFIGSSPSVGQVNNYFAASILAHVAFVTVLDKSYRSTFQVTSIFYEASYAYGNYKINISAKF
jgi:hypothetical protein